MIRTECKLVETGWRLVREQLFNRPYKDRPKQTKPSERGFGMALPNIGFADMAVLLFARFQISSPGSLHNATRARRCCSRLPAHDSPAERRGPPPYLALIAS